MKKINLINALELAKETLAQLSDQELQYVAGGTQDDYDEQVCVSGTNNSCNTSSCPQGGGQPK
ncbi:class I lanthipeptide [Spirosoma sp.]|uniref:class I lanthipeptide n=1 Tax=Spirosoma sp. TaxID=1899569 RepID=UPI00261BC54B|nr:class I lanthipeptide [Spirosoma sp.]MCX6212987.1 class I lanthipeptide [Spirosoma sp.]